MEKIKLSQLNLEKNKITSSKSALEFIKHELDLNQENFILIGLDCKNQIIFTKTLFKGGLNWCCVEPKLIFKELLVNGCYGFVMAHNHPSGDLTPSEEDKKISNKIKGMSKILEFQYVDNLIFDENKYISFYDEDLL